MALTCTRWPLFEWVSSYQRTSVRSPCSCGRMYGQASIRASHKPIMLPLAFGVALPRPSPVPANAVEATRKLVSHADTRRTRELAGNQHICQNLNFIGIHSPGLQPLWNVPANLVRMPDTLALDDAALVDPVADAVHDARRSELAADGQPDAIGAGPIGMLIATVARDFGAEVDDDRRAAVGNLGFRTLDPRAEDQVSAVGAWTGEAGADVMFEVSGAAGAVLGATSLAKMRGTIVVVAIHPQPRPVDLQRVLWRELRISGALLFSGGDDSARSRVIYLMLRR